MYEIRTQKEVRKVIHDNVRDIRKAKGVSATHIGKALGYVTSQGYYYLESGQVDMSAEKLKVIANVLGEDVGVFFDDELTKIVTERIRGVGVARD